MRLAPCVVAALASCYSPELRDCTVRCSRSADCLADQVCGGDGYCAAADVAGQCRGTHPIVDAADVGPSDAPPPPPDAGPPHAALRIEFSGKGRVVVTGVGSCEDSPCDYTVLANVTLVVTAIPDDDFRFDKWETEVCKDQGATCFATAMAPMTRIKARFRSDD
jgi:hypothetical protein